jgi:hypothetical protein
MNKCAPETGESASLEPVSLELRRAQRAFAALLEAHRRVGEFRGAQLRRGALRTLSELSADARAGLAEWLSLQLAGGDNSVSDNGESALGLLARIEMRLAARVRRALPARIEALAIHSRSEHIVAA